MKRGRGSRESEQGSAAIELLAALPLLAALAIVAWYLATGLVAAMDANEALVRAGLDARGSPSESVEIDATRAVSAFGRLPGYELAATARVRPR